MLDIFPSLGRPGYDGSQSLPLGAARDREAASRPPLPPAMLLQLSERQSPQVNALQVYSNTELQQNLTSLPSEFSLITVV